MFVDNNEEMPVLSERTKIEFICKECGTEVKTVYRSFKINPKFLCKSCKIKDKLKNSDKSSTVLKREETCLRKYGVKNPQQSKDIRDKTKNTISKKNKELLSESITKKEETCLRKYGVKNYFSSEEFKTKKEETLLTKYGVKNYFSSEEFLKRNEITLSKLVEKHKNIIEENNLEFIGFSKEMKNLRFKCKECSIEFNGRIYNKGEEIYISKCPVCFNKFKTSTGEKEMSSFLESLITVEKNKKFSNKYELDCYIPSLNIGFEYDGLYWHSSVFKDDYYHKDKNNYFRALGIKVYHIFSDEWIYKNDIIKSIIKSKINIYDSIYYARKLVIKNVSKKEEKEFLNCNHVQGYVNSKTCLGLYNGEELISLMSFGKSRFNKKSDYELLRFVNKINTRNIGGASRLFSYYKKNYNVSSIISYCDLRLFDGELYSKLGFSFSHVSSPNYYYINGEERFNRIKFQKHKLKKLFPNHFSDEKTEKEIMAEAGFTYIYDCGMGVYLLDKNKDML